MIGELVIKLSVDDLIYSVVLLISGIFSLLSFSAIVGILLLLTAVLVIPFLGKYVPATPKVFCAIVSVIIIVGVVR